MTAVWQTRLTASASRMLQGSAALVDYAAQPRVFSRIKTASILLLAAWVVVSAWRAAWSFLPETAPLPETTVVNPIPVETEMDAAPTVDIEALAAVDLFGTPGSVISDEALAAAAGRSPAMSEYEASTALAGIEDGAPETRLPLLLRGVVAASDAGLGQAVIEHRNLQDLYRVGDELPVSGEVVLAKVLPARVVIDNGGRYEILRLFEESELSRQASELRGAASMAVPATESAPAAPQNEAPDRELSAGADAAALAARYRDRLYDDPESLADVVRVSAVRDGAALRGYRLAPGRSSEGFAALGFQDGDIVTAINGLSLADPSNTMRLYQAMRSAQAATFELERGDETLTLSVSLDGGSDN